MIYFYTKFYVHGPNGLLVITIKPITKYIFHAATIFCFTFKKTTSTKAAYFSNISYHTSFQDSILSDASVTPNSKVPASAMLALPIVGN
jgi:hypothetical protein